MIAQRRRRHEVDGETFGGGGPALPAYGTAEFDALAQSGANLVVMSFPELWSVAPPWRRDAAMADVLGRQLDAARAAGLYVVLALRSGPGRSDFIFHRDAQGTWFPASLIVDSIWTRREEQTAWAEMCVDAAKLVAERGEIAGLNIMVEPDPNVSGVNREGRRLGAWTAEDYLAQVGETSDWRRIARDVARKVREAAPQLPILISPPAFARTDFLPVMGAPPVEGVVWCVHDYEPRAYTHATGRERGLYPYPQDAKAFAARLDAVRNAGAPVFLGEFGASSAALSRHAYHSDRIAACEARGIGWAAFRWPTHDAAYEASDAMFDLTNTSVGDRDENAPRTIDVLKSAWARNTQRPARTPESGRGQLRGRNR